MIIKKSEDPAMLRTPRERRSEATRGRYTLRGGLQEHSNFIDLIHNSASKTNEKSDQGKPARKTRTFTLGSLEKREKSQGRSSAKFQCQSKPTRPKLGKYCSQHPNKPASHVAMNDRNQAAVFCEKCSIGLVSRGWMLSRIEPSTDRQPRSCDELDRFMNDLNIVLNELLQRKEDTAANIKRCESEFGQQIEELSEYFSVLQLTLQMEKNRQYTHILAMKRDSEAEQRRLCGIYEKCIDELNRILDNIVVVKENITDDYDKIVQEFSPKLQRYSEIVRSGPTRFTIKPLKLASLEDVQDRFRELIGPGQGRVCRSIISKLHDEQSRSRTIVTQYDKSLDLQPTPSESNLITQHEEEAFWKPTKSDILIQLIGD